MKTEISNGHIVTAIKDGDRIDDEHIYTGPTIVVSKTLPGKQIQLLESYKKKRKKRSSGTNKKNTNETQGTQTEVS